MKSSDGAGTGLAEQGQAQGQGRQTQCGAFRRKICAGAAAWETVKECWLLASIATLYSRAGLPKGSLLQELRAKFGRAKV